MMSTAVAPPAKLPATNSQAQRPLKSSTAFRTISEVAEELDVAQHVLRFWESKFAQVRPLKRGGGRRYYRPEDVELLRQIRSLLYDEGYTIKGAQKLLRARRTRPGDEVQETSDGVREPPRQAALEVSAATTRASDIELHRRLTPIIDDLAALRDRLRRANR
jgi:DNA-binding transcriptional MerR regulator